MAAHISASWARKVVTFLLPILLSACGAQIDPASLKPPAAGTVAELTGGYVYLTRPGGIYDQQTKYELTAASYVAELESDEGTYFRGPAGCLGMSISTSTNKNQPLNQVSRFEGGVFVPRSPDKPARIYYYQLLGASDPSPGTTPAIAQRSAPTAGVGAGAVGAGMGGGIVAGIISYGRGKISYTPGAQDDSLRAAIVFRKREVSWGGQ
jgi:hypothetical protein